MANTRTIVSSTPIKQKCMDCDAEYMASKVIYSDGHENITPKRCETCQTNHLTNLRVDKAITANKHIGNLRNRLTEVQRDAIVAALENSLGEVIQRFQGTVMVKSGFDIGEIQ